MKPRVAIALGDPAGIGPELVAKLLSMPETRAEAHCVVIGDRWLFERGCADAGLCANLDAVESLDALVAESDAPVFLELPTVDPEEVELGEARACGGRSALAVLARAADLAVAGAVDAILFAPLNKQALHLAGFGFEDELRWFADRLGHDGYVTELNVLDSLWTSRVTSHVPLKDVAAAITGDGIVDAVRLVHSELRAAGIDRPRIGVAALNPHAGDGGNFGTEEIEVIAPAVERVRAEQIQVEGPFPADTVFVRAKDGGFDAVVTMYHDQGQIAMKLMGFGRGVTVLGGLPIPVATPGHGTAYDIAGTGRATTESTRQAFLIACRMGRGRMESRAAAAAAD